MCVCENFHRVVAWESNPLPSCVEVREVKVLISLSLNHRRRFLFSIGGPLIEAPKVPMSNAEGVRIEVPWAPRVWGVGGGTAPSPENFSIVDLKMVSFDALCVVF